jgi:hypothetical protein
MRVNNLILIVWIETTGIEMKSRAPEIIPEKEL